MAGCVSLEPTFIIIIIIFILFCFKLVLLANDFPHEVSGFSKFTFHCFVTVFYLKHKYNLFKLYSVTCVSVLRADHLVLDSQHIGMLFSGEDYFPTLQHSVVACSLCVKLGLGAFPSPSR